MKRLLLILALLAGSLAYGQTVGSFGNWCQAGNQFSVVSGLLSTNALQGSYPSCTVTVYLTGTLIPATIYASPALGALTNPFTANADGSFTFWAATNALYDVVISGVGMPAPHTFAAVGMFAPYGGTLPVQYTKLRCESGLGDGLNAMAAGTYLQSFCYNDSGVTWTITGIKCFTDNSGSSTLNAAGNTLGALLTGPITCTSAFAAGIQSVNIALTTGDYIKFTFIADGTSKQTTWVVSMGQ